MSENRDRNYSKYDAMMTEELEEILRLDASAPDGEESDTELLLYVMGVLANRRNNTNITGNTAQQAWQSFQKNYLADEEKCLEDIQENTGHRTVIPWMRRLIAAAAVFALVILIPVSANALSLDKLWDIFARWAKETFSFVTGEDTQVSDPSPVHKEEYMSLQEVLANSMHDEKIVPVWIPEGFILDKIEKDISPIQEIYRATYRNGDKVLKMQIQIYLESDPGKVEVNEELLEIYESCNVEYYIFSNYEQIRAIWITAPYECYISGEIPIDDLRQMIDSIEKG